MTDRNFYFIRHYSSLTENKNAYAWCKSLHLSVNLVSKNFL